MDWLRAMRDGGSSTGRTRYAMAGHATTRPYARHRGRKFRVRAALAGVIQLVVRWGCLSPAMRRAGWRLCAVSKSERGASVWEHVRDGPYPTRGPGLRHGSVDALRDTSDRAERARREASSAATARSGLCQSCAMTWTGRDRSERMRPIIPRFHTSDARAVRSRAPGIGRPCRGCTIRLWLRCQPLQDRNTRSATTPACVPSFPSLRRLAARTCGRNDPRPARLVATWPLSGLRDRTPRHAMSHHDLLLRIKTDVYRRLIDTPLADTAHPNFHVDFAAVLQRLPNANSLAPECPSRESARAVALDQELDGEAASEANEDVRGAASIEPSQCAGVADGVGTGRACPPVAQPVRRSKRKRQPPQQNLSHVVDLDDTSTPCDSHQPKARAESKTQDLADKPDTPTRPAKRGAVTRTRPSQQLMVKLHRALSHPLFLIERQDNGRSFVVMGATGNVYTVKIECSPSCTCRDFQKGAGSNRRGGPCKHILFVMHRVLKVERTDPKLYQVALLTSEVEEIYANAPQMTHDDLLADEAARRQFRELGSQDNESSLDATSASVECAVCLLSLPGSGPALASSVVACGQCRQRLHKACMDKVIMHSSARPRCPLCRACWRNDLGNEHINLAQYSRHHAVRLTEAQLYPDTHQHLSRSRRGM